VKNSITNKFIEKSQKKFGDRLTYEKTEYLGGLEKVILTCVTHGDFKVKPSNHLSSKIGGCPHCISEAVLRSGVKGRTNKNKTTEEFIIECKSTHPYSDYDYSKTVYVNKRTKVIIICPVHGEFQKFPSDFLRGDNCPLCKIRNGKKIVKDRTPKIYARDTNPDAGYGWTKTDFISRCINNDATLYIIKFFNNEELFYKIGITSKTIKHRFQKTKTPYLYEIIKEVHGDPGLIYDLEKVLLRDTKEYSYSPESKFGGHTECRTSDFFTSEQIKAIMS